jgi:hypothetical protein
MLVRYHQQDNDYYCGPATLQMLIDSTGDGRGLAQQDVLAAEMGTKDVGVATTPCAMLRAFDNHISPRLGRRFALHQDDTYETSMARIVQAVTGTDGFPPAVMWDNGQHWVLVNAVSYLPAKQGSGLSCIFVDSPIVAAQSGTPPLHFRDDSCGRNAAQGARNSAFSYDYWSRTFTAAGDLGFVSVLPSALLSARPINPPRSPIFPTGGLQWKEAALCAIAAYGLNVSGPLAPILQKVNGVGNPEIVLYELSESQVYSGKNITLLPLTCNGVQIADIALEPSDGGYMTNVSVFEDPPQYVDADGARKIAISFASSLRQSTDAKTLAIWDSSADPVLVWRSCSASIFPTLPFYRVPLGELIVYVRRDGVPFGKLT